MSTNDIMMAEHKLEGVLVHLKQDFEGSGDTGDLDFAPQSALVTADAIHYARNVSEVIFEFLFQDLAELN